MLLEKARAHCDRLVVGLESEGAPKAVQDQAARAYVLASLVFSDAVVICDAPQVDRLLATIIPDVVLALTGTPAEWTSAWSGELIELQAAAKLHAGQAGD
jgi:bifunctional ADP-heptose synthase (sugar kinase/adenylyltransferase)